MHRRACGGTHGRVTWWWGTPISLQSMFARPFKHFDPPTLPNGAPWCQSPIILQTTSNSSHQRLKPTKAMSRSTNPLMTGFDPIRTLPIPPSMVASTRPGLTEPEGGLCFEILHTGLTFGASWRADLHRRPELALPRREKAAFDCTMPKCGGFAGLGRAGVFLATVCVYCGVSVW
jgi:hypothetical protein